MWLVCVKLMHVARLEDSREYLSGSQAVSQKGTGFIGVLDLGAKQT